MQREHLLFRTRLTLFRCKVPCVPCLVVMLLWAWTCIVVWAKAHYICVSLLTDTSIDCDTFIFGIDTCAYQPWCSSFPISENGLRFSFTTYARVKSSNESDALKAVQIPYINRETLKKL